jgi:hypothetical protein
MQENGVRPDQISQVRVLLIECCARRTIPKIRRIARISLIVQCINKDEQQTENANAGAGKTPEAAPKAH